jgi:hypothetical protein
MPHIWKLPCSAHRSEGPFVAIRLRLLICSEGIDRSAVDVLSDGVVVGRIFKVHAAPVGSPCMWTLGFGHHQDRTPTHGYAATREAAMVAFANSWRAIRRIRRPCRSVPALYSAALYSLPSLAHQQPTQYARVQKTYVNTLTIASSETPRPTEMLSR